MSQEQELLGVLNNYPVTHSLVGNGDILVTNERGKSYYFTISTNKWRAKGKTTRYSSQSLTHFIETYCLN